MNRATIENKGDSRFFAATKDYSFVLDTEGRGANPLDALLASLCACVGHMTREYLKKNGIEHTGFRVEAESQMTDDLARIADIRLDLDLSGTELDAAGKSALLSSVNACKIRQTLKNACDVQIALGGVTPAP